MKHAINHDALREHLLSSLGMTLPRRVPDLPELRRGQWSAKFEQLQRHRLIMGAFRYGLLDEQRATGGNGYDNVGSLIKRAEAYQATGNLEYLVDVANLAMVEFEVGSHPTRHFVVIDDGEHTKANL